VSRFQAGVSGNPGGRPAGLSKVSAAAREHSDAAVALLVSVMENDATDIKLRVQVADMLLNRAWGRPAAALEPAEQRAVEMESELRERRCLREQRRYDEHDELNAMFKGKVAK
jgi:hypothetical protein